MNKVLRNAEALHYFYVILKKDEATHLLELEGL